MVVERCKLPLEKPLAPGSLSAPQAPLCGFVLDILIWGPHQRASFLVLLLNFHSLKLISSDEMDESPSGMRGPRPLPDCDLDKWVRFVRWKGILALMWFYSRTLWIYTLTNSIMVSSKKNNDLHVTDWNWKSFSSSSPLKPFSFSLNHQAFLKLCALRWFSTVIWAIYIQGSDLDSSCFAMIDAKLLLPPQAFYAPRPLGWFPLRMDAAAKAKHLGGGWTLQSFPVWHLFLPTNLLRHTEPAAVPFKQQPVLLLSAPTFMLTSAPRWELPWRFPHGCLGDGIGAERGAGLLQTAEASFFALYYFLSLSFFMSSKLNCTT